MLLVVLVGRIHRRRRLLLVSVHLGIGRGGLELVDTVAHAESVPELPAHAAQRRRLRPFFVVHQLEVVRQALGDHFAQEPQVGPVLHRRVAESHAVRPLRVPEDQKQERKKETRPHAQTRARTETNNSTWRFEAQEPHNTQTLSEKKEKPRGDARWRGHLRAERRNQREPPLTGRF